MIIFQTSKHELRRWLERTEVRLNILRLCARRPYTLSELAQIDLGRTPRLEVSHRGVLAEINVSVGIGECLRRELLVKVGEERHSTLREGHMDLLRTTLFAFLLSPRLARLEPEAYTTYVSSWLAQPEPRERFFLSLKGLPEAEAAWLYRLQWELFLVLPEYLYRGFASFAARPELGFAQLLRLGRARIGLNQPRFQGFLLEKQEEIARVLACLPFRQRDKLRLLLKAATRPSAKLFDPLAIAPLERAALQAERLGPLFSL